MYQHLQEHLKALGSKNSSLLLQLRSALLPRPSPPPPPPPGSPSPPPPSPRSPSPPPHPQQHWHHHPQCHPPPQHRQHLVFNSIIIYQVPGKHLEGICHDDGVRHFYRAGRHEVTWPSVVDMAGALKIKEVSVLSSEVAKGRRFQRAESALLRLSRRVYLLPLKSRPSGSEKFPEETLTPPFSSPQTFSFAFSHGKCPGICGILSDHASANHLGYWNCRFKATDPSLSLSASLSPWFLSKQLLLLPKEKSKSRNPMVLKYTNNALKMWKKINLGKAIKSDFLIIEKC